MLRITFQQTLKEKERIISTSPGHKAGKRKLLESHGGLWAPGLALSHESQGNILHTAQPLSGRCLLQSLQFCGLRPVRLGSPCYLHAPSAGSQEETFKKEGCKFYKCFILCKYINRKYLRTDELLMGRMSWKASWISQSVWLSLWGQKHGNRLQPHYDADSIH